MPPLTPIAQQVCEKRYFQKDKDGNIIEDWDQLVSRIIKHVCKDEDDNFQKAAYDLLYKTEFLPNSPCLVNAGTSTKSKGLLACFVTKSPEDSWIGMLENIGNYGHIARQGGGAGVDFSQIRPEGDPVFGSTHARACGPIEHMRMISEVMSSITQSGFRGMACCSYDTLVSTELGFIPIGQIVEENLTGIEVHTQFGSATITNAWCNGTKDVYEIITEKGNKLKLTGDHEVYVIENYNGQNHGKLSKKINEIGVWKEVKDLDLNKDCLVLNLDEKPFASAYAHINGIKIDEQLASLIAYAKCDGLFKKYNGCQRLELALDSKESIKLFMNSNHVSFNQMPTRSNGITVLRKEGKSTEFLENFGEFGTYHCDIPFEIFRSPQSVIAAFLQAAFDAEGTVDVSEDRCRIITGMTSLEFVEGLQILLGMFGIQSQLRRDVVHINKDGIQRHNMHYLSISNKWHVKKFMEQIGFLSKRKNTAANKAIKHLDFSGGRGKSPSSKIIHRLRSLSPLGQMNVYDISTTNETFLANNLVVHNCMGCLHVSHPDIMKFIVCKQKDRALKTMLKEDIFNHYDAFKSEGVHEHLEIVLDKFISNFNVSVFATDDFMRRVENNEDYDLVFNDKVYATVNAREVFEMIVHNAWQNGDPGMLFHETINNGPYKYSNQPVTATNPCGEQCLPQYGSCNLGSIDVSKFYNEDREIMEWTRLGAAIEIAVQFLDNVLSVNFFPTPEFGKWAKDNRPVGLGVMGWADLLLKMKITYGSEDSFKFAQKLGRFFEKTSHEKSVALGQERGTPKACRYDELEHRRNATTLSIAPTGTISLLAGCSSSIEPVFSAVTYRYDNTGAKEMRHPYAKKSWFKCTTDLSWQEHVGMQAAWQPYIDSAISKTINFPNEATKEDVKNAYMSAWKSGCKGITVYRDGCKSTQVLNTSAKPVVGANHAKPRPKEVTADIFRTTADGFEWHVIVGKVNDVPYEVFAVNGKQDLPSSGKVVKRKKRHYSLMGNDNEVIIENLGAEEDEIHPRIGLETRRFSLELRHNIDPKHIVAQIDKSSDVITSFSKAVGRIMKNKYISAADLCEVMDVPCFDCAKNGKEVQMIADSGCWKCPVCFGSKCG